MSRKCVKVSKVEQHSAGFVGHLNFSWLDRCNLDPLSILAEPAFLTVVLFLVTLHNAEFRFPLHLLLEWLPLTSAV